MSADYTLLTCRDGWQRDRRSYVGIELSPIYTRLAERHLADGLEEHRRRVWKEKS